MISLEFTLNPDDIQGDYEPAQNGGWTDPSWPESYRAVAIRIGKTWIPVTQLDKETVLEVEHYMLETIRDEAEAAREAYADWVYEYRKDRQMMRG